MRPALSGAPTSIEASRGRQSLQQSAPGQSVVTIRTLQTRMDAMAKATTIKIKLESTADTGFFYTAKKNSRTMTEKMVKRKYDPVAKKHVDFKETKIK